MTQLAKIDESLGSVLDIDERGRPVAPVAGGGHLNGMQKLFCSEYLADLNATQAAIRAGYSKDTACVQGSRLLSADKIQAEIQRLMDRRTARCNITADWVLNTLVETVERCKQARPVLDRKGQVVMAEDDETGELRPVYQYDAANVIRATELLGKHLKLFSDRVELTGRNGGAIEVITAATSPDDAARIYRDMIER